MTEMRLLPQPRTPVALLEDHRNSKTKRDRVHAHAKPNSLRKPSSSRIVDACEQAFRTHNCCSQESLPSFPTLTRECKKAWWFGPRRKSYTAGKLHQMTIPCHEFGRTLTSRNESPRSEPAWWHGKEHAHHSSRQCCDTRIMVCERTPKQNFKTVP